MPGMTIEMAKGIVADLIAMHAPVDDKVALIAAKQRLGEFTLAEWVEAQQLLKEADAVAPVVDGKRTLHVTLADDLLAATYVANSFPASPLEGKQAPVATVAGVGVFLIRLPEQEAPETENQPTEASHG